MKEGHAEGGGRKMVLEGNFLRRAGGGWSMVMPNTTSEVANFSEIRMKYVNESQDCCRRRYGSYTYSLEQLVE